MGMIKNMGRALAEYSGVLPKVEISGNGTVLIESHRGLIQYDTETVTVKSGMADIKIRGRGLMLEMMTDTVVKVRGTVFSVELSY